MNQEIVESLKKRYDGMHPLIFKRSVEHAESDVELFDILDTVPKKFPIYWEDSERRWKRASDISFQKKFLEDVK